MQLINRPYLIIFMVCIAATVILYTLKDKQTDEDWVNTNIKMLKDNQHEMISKIKNIFSHKQLTDTTVVAEKESKVSDTAKKEPKMFIEERFQNILKSCGELCDFSIKPSPADFMDTRRAKVDCRAIFLNEEIDKPHKGKPPKWNDVSKFIQNTLTHNNETDTKIWYFDESGMGGAMKENNPKIFREADIEKLVEMLKKGKSPPSYTGAVQDVLVTLREAVSVVGKHVLVIGTQNPWLEAILIFSGASKVTTLEYGNIVSKHPRLDFIRPDKFRAKFLDGSLPVFDFIFTYSSLEHSGLGRYGDAQNPWGDMLTLSRAWCASGPHTKLVLSVPVNYKKDCVAFNAGRYYGPVLYPYLVTNWKFEWASEAHKKKKMEWKPSEFCDSAGQPVYVFSRLPDI